MNKKILLLVVASLLLVSGVFAFNAAYVVTNPAQYEQGYITALNQMNYTVTIIDDSQVASTNFSNYDLLIVGNNHFSNPSAIPVNKRPSVILNSPNIVDWGFSDGTSQQGSNQPLKAINQVYNSEAAYITRNLPHDPTTMQVYSSCCFPNNVNIPMYYLSRLDVLNQLKKVTSTTSNSLDSVVAVRTNGTVMKNGETAKARGCFFGAVSADYWTPQTKQLFQQCVDWAVLGKDSDGDGYYSDVDCNDLDASIHPNALELNDGIDQNCVNDAPIVSDFPQITFNEDGSASFNISQYVTDLDNKFANLSFNYSGVVNVIPQRSGTILNLSSLPNWYGSENISVIVKDPLLASANGALNVVVTSVNDAPVLLDIPDQEVEQFSQFSYTAICTDLENNSLIFSDNFASFDISPITGVISWVPGANDVGDYTIEIGCSDGIATVFDSFILTVRVKNTAPVLSVPPQEVLEDGSKIISLNSFASDAQNDLLSFVVINQNVSQAACSISGSNLTITPAANWNGLASCGVIASDGRLNSSESVFQVIVAPVNDAPIMDSLLPLSTVASYQVRITPVVSDIDSTNLTVSVNSPFFVKEGNDFVWTPSYNQTGSYTVVFTVSDGVLENSQEFNLEVKPKLLINEFASDSETDRDNNSFVDTGDEFIELYNPSNSSVTVVSWKLEMDDSSDTFQFINAIIAPGQHYVLLNPAGTLDNDGQLRIFDHEGLLVDKVSYGSFDDGNIVDNAPNGHTSSVSDECIARSPDGLDSDVDSIDFIKKACTPGVDNNKDILPPQVLLVGPGDDYVSDSNVLNVTFSITDNVALSVCDLLVDGVVVKSLNLTSASFSGSLVYEAIPDNTVLLWSLSCSDSSNNIVNTLARTFSVAINDAPIVNLPNVTVNEDESYLLNLSEYASDPDGDELSFILKGQKPNEVACSLSGSELSIIPATNWNGIASCNVTVSDGLLATPTLILMINVMPVNDAPTVSGIPDLITTEDVPVSFEASGYVSDIDSVVFTYALDGFDNFTISENNGSVEFVPPADWSGVASGVLKVSDGEFVVDTNIFTVTVTPVNDAPRFSLPELVTDEDVVLTIDLIDYVSDVESDPFIFEITSQNSSQVNCELSGSVLTLTPFVDWNGLASCTLRVDDGSNEAFSVAAVTVTPINDAPTLLPIPDSSINEDSSLVIDLSDYVSDIDGDVLTFSADGFAEVSASLNLSVLTLVPPSDWSGVTSGKVIVSDGVTSLESNMFTVTINAVNDAPVLNVPLINMTEDTAVSIDLSEYVVDIENDSLTFEVISQNDSEVGCVLDNALLTLTPATNWNGLGSCGLQVSDGNDTFSSEVLFSVALVNDAPVFVSEIPTQFVNEDSSLTFDLASYVSDVDSFSLTFTAVTSTNLKLTITGSAIKVVPVPNYNGNDTVHVTISDGEFVIESDFLITTVPVNDVPIILSSPVLVGQQNSLYEYQLSAADIDGDVLEYSVVKGPPGMVVNSSNGLVSFMPSQADVGQFVVTLKVDDLSGGSRIQTYVLTIVDVNDAPVLTQPIADMETPEDIALVVDLSDYIHDSDNSVLNYVATGFTNVAVTFSANKATFKPSQNWNGITSGKIVASDGSLGVVSNEFSLTVIPRNDAPFFTSSPVADAFEGRLYSYDVNAADVENDSLTFSLLQAPSGMVIDPISGVISYTPNASAIGQHVVSVQVSDGLAINVQPFVLTVNDIDQPPALTENIPDLLTSEDVEVSIDLSNYFSDEDSARLTYSATGFTNVVVIIDESTARLIPVRDWNGVASGKFVASADGSSVSSNNVSVTVTPVNDAPLVDAVSDMTLVEGGMVVVNVNAVDIENDPLVYAISDSRFVQDGSTFRWITQVGDRGVYPVVVTVSDGSDSNSQAFTVTVLEPVSCADADNDLVCDNVDNCPSVANPNQADSDNDGIGNACDSDDDNDGVLDTVDNCLFTPNPDQANADNDSYGNACDSDDDNDGVEDGDDNCPLASNPDQIDSDGDGVGDVCDSVVGENLPPVIITSPLSTAEVGKEYVYRLVAQDPEHDGLSYEVSDDRFEIDGSTFRFVPKVNGTVPVSFSVEDSAGNIVSQSVTIAVGGSKDAPESHYFTINRASFYEDRVYPGDLAELYFSVKNRGNQEEKNVAVQVTSPELDLYDSRGKIKLERLGSYSGHVFFDVPYGTKPGDYVLKITAENSHDRDVHYVTLTVR